MSIKRIEVKNFKSFKELKVDLRKFNVLIGKNASGKSNFVSIFEFLRDISTWGLENAISMQGGAEYLRNMNVGASEPLSVKVVSNEKFKLARQVKGGLIGIETYETIYEFKLSFHERDSGFKVIKDELRHKCKFYSLKEKDRQIERKQILGEGGIAFSRSNGKIKIDTNIPSNIPLKEEDLCPPFLKEIELSEQELQLEIPHILLIPIKKTFSEIAIYYFDPKLPKKATPITGKAELEGDGSNLSIVLKNIIESDERKRKLFNLIKDVLPFVEDIDIEKFADKSLLFKLKESYFKTRYLPASLISDGTVNVTAIIIALYFEKKPLIIIEEPERNIHPSLISKVVEMMKDASQTQKKQIIVTTHNPEVVKHAGLENILLISRDEDGFSKISRPVDKEKVRIFLEHEIGLEELYVQNLLEA